MKLRQHRFKNAGQLIDFMIDEGIEDDIINELRHSRPLRCGDELSRRTVNIDGKLYWISVVRRSGNVEVWLQRCDFVDTAEHDTTHSNWQLVALLTKGENQHV